MQPAKGMLPPSGKPMVHTLSNKIGLALSKLLAKYVPSFQLWKREDTLEKWSAFMKHV